MILDDIMNELTDNPEKAEELFDMLNSMKGDRMEFKKKENEKKEVDIYNKWYDIDMKPNLVWSENQSLEVQRENIIKDIDFITQKIKIYVTKPYRRYRLNQDQTEAYEIFKNIKITLSKRRKDSR